MDIKFVDLKSQVSLIKSEVLSKFEDIIENTVFISGKFVKEFERSFADCISVKHCIGLNSGTSALMISLMAIDVKPYDEIIMPVNTFIATAEAVSVLGAKPVFVDVVPQTYNLDINQIEKNITQKTKAIIPVHLYGQCADLDKVLEVAKKYKLCVIEDACQAHGAEYKGRKAGTVGDIGCFSFYPGKNLGAWGEAGAVVTNNDIFAEKMLKIRNHGGLKKYEHDVIGCNFRMEEFQGAVLSVKLKYLDKWNIRRREIAVLYNKYLKELEGKGKITLPYEMPYNKRIYHLFVIQTEYRDKVIEYLKNNKIEVGIHYPAPLHLTGAYKDLGYKMGDFPVAENESKKILSLPMHEFLDDNSALYVSEILKKAIK